MKPEKKVRTAMKLTLTKLFNNGWREIAIKAAHDNVFMATIENASHKHYIIIDYTTKNKSKYQDYQNHARILYSTFIRQKAVAHC